MASISLPTAAIIAAGVGGAASIAGAEISGGAATSAAKTQAKAAQLASANQMEEFQQTQKNLSPYMEAGTGALGTAEGLLGIGPNGFDASTIEKSLQATPGYQFTLDQGLKSVQSGYAAEGLANSGAALKGAAQFTTGLADTTYEQQLQNYLQLAGSGQNAAAGLGALGQQAAATAGGFSTSGAAATAAGTVGVANALSSGISNVAGGINNAALLTALSNNGAFGATQPVSPPPGNALQPVTVTPNVYGQY